MNGEPWHLGKYELYECLGRGSMAEVWKAFDTELQRYVAIKFLHANLRTDPDFMMRFVREAQAIASLRHLHIVQVHDFHAPQREEAMTNSRSLVSSMAYMVMEYIQGPTLAEYMLNTSHKRLFPPATEIVHLFTSISSAIDYAHQRGMIHRDIKPANILLDTRRFSRYQMGEPILTDFSIVKLLGMSSSTAVGTLLGTPLYMAPEQARGQPGNEASDIYSLGVILYEICTGVRPFRGDNPSAIMFQHIYETPVSPTLINPTISPTLSEVILRSLAKDPAARFPNASAMAAELADILHPSRVVPSTPWFDEVIPLAGAQTERPDTPTTPINTDIEVPFIPTSKQPTPNDTPTSPQLLSSPLVPATSEQQILTPIPPKSPSGNLSLPLLSVSTFRRRGSIKAISLTLLLLFLIGAGLTTFAFLHHTNSHTGSPENTLVGYALFTSSGNLSDLNNNNIDDELQIKLHTIPPPRSGKAYYAWLLGDKKTPTQSPLLLGKLSVEHGTVTFSYLGNQMHVNLLKDYSQFLVTLESENPLPGTPSSDRSSWLYYASFPQTPDGTLANLSAVDYLRHLLVADSHLQSLHVQGTVGIDVQFLRNIQQVLVETNSASTAWYSKNTSALHNHLVRLLDYLDGTFVQQDIGSGIPLQVDPNLIQTPLLDITRFDGAGSYFTRFPSELNSLINAPGVTPEMRSLARQALAAFPDIQTQLEHIRNQAKALFKLSNAQLLQSSTRDTLHTMVAQASMAYNQIDPSTNQSQGGATWINDKIQRLATFEIYRFNR